MTLLKLGLTFMFATLKFQHLMLHHNPTINSHTEQQVNTESTFDLQIPEFQLAIGLEKFSTAESLNDPTYIQWVAQYMDYDVGGAYKVKFDPIPLHSCTQKDLLDFDLIEGLSSEKDIEKI